MTNRESTHASPTQAAEIAAGAQPVAIVRGRPTWIEWASDDARLTALPGTKLYAAPPLTARPAGMSDEQIIAFCATHGVQWYPPEPAGTTEYGDEYPAFLGGFDMASMDEMRALLVAQAPTPQQISDYLNGLSAVERALAAREEALRIAGAAGLTPDPDVASITLSAADAAFLAARLRRLFKHFNFPLPIAVSDDARLIGIAGSAIGLMLTNAEQPVAWVNGEELRQKANATIACGAERREGLSYDTPLYAAAGVPGAPLPEPDCWAILTPNGSKLVSPEEAKGALGAYPLYRAPGVQPSDGWRP